ncbi:DUF1073 domain-containing protein [Agarivorans sp. B2Z047]|uniref:phage portal protein n=1 Tax=Agarivorans sp. B2Z047 TaxID=2652721 RepID=UPI002019A29A|nr:DUF1073 domain-containing protein [Agarivorans sp. B2Z047]UQN44878.1 DUF1073 domain-containing protein [Agarivorans sp. B2Z047]
MNKKRFNNARYSSPSGADGCMDQGSDYLPNPPRSQQALDQTVSNLFYTDWQANKIVTIPVDDMLRGGWKYTDIEKDQIKKLDKLDQRLDTLDKIKRALTIERLLGGCVIYMGVAANEDKPEEPLHPETVSEGDLKFLNVIPRHRVTRVTVSDNALDPRFGKPETYRINGVEIHESRLLIFDGHPLSYQHDKYLSPKGGSYQIGFGRSVLEPILDDLTRATGTRQAAFHLVNMASVIIAKMELDGGDGSEASEERNAELREIVKQISMYRAAVLDSGIDGKTDIENRPTSFGSVPELLLLFLQVLAASADIPATRFIGQSPGGLNATGDSDLENYYGRIENDREQDLQPQLQKYAIIAAKSAGVEMPEIEFEPLWTSSELEKSTIRVNNATAVTTLSNSGVISDDEAKKQAEELDIIKPIVVEDDQDILDEMNRLLANDNLAA